MHFSKQTFLASRITTIIVLGSKQIVIKLLSFDVKSLPFHLPIWWTLGKISNCSISAFFGEICLFLNGRKSRPGIGNIWTYSIAWIVIVWAAFKKVSFWPHFFPFTQKAYLEKKEKEGDATCDGHQIVEGKERILLFLCFTRRKIYHKTSCERDTLSQFSVAVSVIGF